MTENFFPRICGHSARQSSYILLLFVLLGCHSPARAQTDTGYYRHIVFDNSLASGHYFYSWAQATGGSSIQQEDWRLPVETKTFLTPPNALRIEWQSQAGGGWEAEVRVVNFRYRFPEVLGSNLYFWCFSQEPIPAADLPRIMVSTTREGLQVAEFPPASFTNPIPLSKFVGDIPAKKWVQVRIPLSEFQTGSIYSFRPEFLQDVIFLQGRADGASHTLIIDEVRVDNDPVSSEASTALPTPQNVKAIGYDRHVEVRWDPVNSGALDRYVIYRSLDGRNFEPVGVQLQNLLHRKNPRRGRPRSR